MFKLLAVIFNLVNGQPVMATHYDGVTRYDTLEACQVYLDANREELEAQINAVVQDDDKVLNGYIPEISCEAVTPEQKGVLGATDDDTEGWYATLGDLMHTMAERGFPGSARNPLK